MAGNPPIRRCLCTSEFIHTEEVTGSNRVPPPCGLCVRTSTNVLALAPHRLSVSGDVPKLLAAVEVDSGAFSAGGRRPTMVETGGRSSAMQARTA